MKRFGYLPSGRVGRGPQARKSRVLQWVRLAYQQNRAYHAYLDAYQVYIANYHDGRKPPLMSDYGL